MSFPNWQDLNEQSLLPPLGQRYSPDLGQVAIMVSTEPDFRFIEANIAKTASNYPFFLGNLLTFEQKSLSCKNEFLSTDKFISSNINEKRASVAGPYLGSPYATMILESLIVKGVSKVVVVGWCGAISPELKTGDIFIPNSAICDEGTSRNYMDMPSDTNFPTVYPNHDFTAKLKTLLETYDNIICQQGRLWTTDAIYRETPKKIAFFCKMGAVAVEMECSALFAVAKYRNIDIASVMVVSDSLTSPKWKPGFKDSTFKEARRRVLRAIINIVFLLN